MFLNLLQRSNSIFIQNFTRITLTAIHSPLLCDPSGTLISAIGLKKAPSGTTRGVFVVDKSGKVLAAEPGSPAGTLAVVKKLLAAGGEFHFANSQKLT